MDRPNSKSYYTYSDEDEDEYPPPAPPPPRPKEEADRGIMATWFSRERIQLAATAVASGVVVAGAILGYQHVRRIERVEDLKRSVPDLGDGHAVDKVRCSLGADGISFRYAD